MSEFKWAVAVNGYGWRGESGDRVLMPMDLRDAADFPTDEDDYATRRRRPRFATREYEPFREETGLFRDFADLPQTEDAIRTFAGKYGMLGPDMKVSTPPLRGERLDEITRRVREDIHDFHASTERLDHWRRAIVSMRQAVSLLDEIGTGADESAAERLEALVEERLEVLGVVARFRLAARPSRQPPLHVVPFTLHGAMWLQLAQAATGDKEFRQCAQCRKWFELEPDVNRTSRVYCSDKCRSQAYRARKATARELWATGKTVAEIVKALDSDAKAVRGWVRARRSK